MADVRLQAQGWLPRGEHQRLPGFLGSRRLCMHGLQLKHAIRTYLQQLRCDCRRGSNAGSTANTAITATCLPRRCR